MDENTPPQTPSLNGSQPPQPLPEPLDLSLENHVSNSVASSAPVTKPLHPATNSEHKHTDVSTTPAIPLQLLSPKALLHSGTLDRISRLLHSANGLDKIIRTIQYTTRLLSHAMLLKQLHTRATSTAATGIRRQFGLTRRLLRCFNNIAQLDATATLLFTSRQRIAADTVGYACALVEGIGYSVFGLADSLGYLPDAGIVGIPYHGFVDKLAFHAWLYALAASIVGGLVKAYRLRQRVVEYRAIFPASATEKGGVAIMDPSRVEEEKEGETSSVGVVVQSMPPTPPGSPAPVARISVSDAASSVVKGLEEQRVNVELNIVGSVADIVFPLAALKVPGFGSLSDGVLGFAGCVSSAVGLRKAWRATA